MKILCTYTVNHKIDGEKVAGRVLVGLHSMQKRVTHMNISKHTSLIKIALSLPLGLAVTCSSMNVAKSRDSILTSRADYRQTSQKTWTREAEYSDWTAVDSYTITNWVQITPYTQDYERENFVQNCGLQIGISGGHELEYYVTVQYGANTVAEGNWKSTSELQYVGYDWDNHDVSGNAYINYYVRRVDGQPLSRNDIENTLLFVNGYSVEYVQESAGTTAIPQEWINNTTQTISSQSTVTTAVTTYNSAVVSEALVVPQKINVGMRFLGGILQQLFDLKYITFLSCFVIVCALVAWLLH